MTGMADNERNGKDCPPSHLVSTHGRPAKRPNTNSIGSTELSTGMDLGGTHNRLAARHPILATAEYASSIDTTALTKDPLDSTDLDPKSLESQQQKCFIPFPDAVRQSFIDIFHYINVFISLFTFSCGVTLPTSCIPSALVDSADSATILTFQKKAIWAQMEEYQRQLDRTTRDMNSLESKVYETLQAITHLPELTISSSISDSQSQLVTTASSLLHQLNILSSSTTTPSLSNQVSQQQGRIEMLESKLDTTDQLLIRTEKKLDRLRLQSNALPTSNSSATANNVNAIGRGAAIGNRSETTDSAMSASTPALHQSSSDLSTLVFEERAVEATRLAEFRLNEIQLLKKDRIALQNDINSLRIEARFALLDDARSSQARVLDMDRQLRYEITQQEVMRNELERVLLENQTLHSDRRMFTDQVRALEAKERKTLEADFRKLELDLHRIRSGRDTLQKNLDERTARDDVEFKQNQELRLIANTCIEIKQQHFEALVISLQSEDPISDLSLKLTETEDARQALAVQLEKYTRIFGSTESDSGVRLEAQAHELEEFATKCKYYQKTESRLLTEIETIGKAWADLESQNSKRVTNLTEKEDHIMRLLAEKTKYEQKFAMLSKQSTTYNNMGIALRRQSDKQLEQIRKQEDIEKNLSMQLQVLEKEAATKAPALEKEKRKVAELLQQVGQYKDRFLNATQRCDQLVNVVKQKTELIEHEADAKRRLQEQVELLKKKMETITNSQPQDAQLLKQLEEYKLLLKCQSCSHNFKSHVLLKCMHTFCKDCIDTIYNSRQRKCPACGTAFGQQDKIVCLYVDKGESNLVASIPHRPLAVALPFPSFRSFPTHLLPSLAAVSSASAASLPTTYDSIESPSGSDSQQDARSSTLNPSSSRKHHRKHHRKDHRKDHHKKSKRHKSSSHSTSQISHHTPADTAPSTSFYIDKRGNLDNIVYEGIRGTDIPLYKRYARIPILGASIKWRLVSRGLMGKAVIHSSSTRHGLIHIGMSNKERYTVFKTMLRSVPVRIHAIIRKTGDVDVDLSAFEQDLAFQVKSKDADQLIRKDVKNAESWISFVKLQDELLTTVAPTRHSAMKRAVAEKKISILEKALKSLPRDERILAMYMDCITEIHGQTHYSQFSVTSSLESYQECLSTLQEDNLVPDVGRESNMLHVFTRACALLFQSGNTEKSIAAFQAMIEFSCYCPAAFCAQSFEKRVELFESFWESECARFGESDAKGWELSLMNELEEDPFRTVLFDDIRGMMFDVKCPETKRYPFLNDELANPVSSASFISFTRATANGGHGDDEQNTSQAIRSLAYPIRTFPLSVWTLVSDGFSWLSNFTAMDARLVDSLGAGRRTMIGVAVQQSHTLFGNDPWLLPMLLSIEVSSHPKSVEKMAKALLKSDRMNLVLWNAYARVLLQRGKVDEARNGGTSVYTLLADLEYTHGKSTTVLNVLIAFSEKGSIPADYSTLTPTPTRLLKTRKYFEQLIDQLLEHIDPAAYNYDMQHLLDALYGLTMLDYLLNGIDSSNKLFKSTLEKCRDVAGRRQCKAGVLQHSTLLGSDQGSGQMPLNSSLPSLMVEYIYEPGRAIFMHSSSGKAFKPVLLRDMLEEALEIYSTNTLLLVVYGWNEACTGIENRVRRFLSQLYSRSPSHVILLFSAWSEMHQRGVVNSHVVRSLFEKAIEAKESVHSVSIWYMAIEFEARQETQNKLDRAKALFYRGIRECPWAKELYMLAFTTLAPAFTQQELAQVYNLMEEKEIRIRSVADVV
ncbi:hypothetical protein BSLG_005063 [Batrachochytrium salamandrivorans]|nr:hypothetical protein BSLG_005063 [Batrachochytrium salamandrivorans]